ncbi:phosphatidylinositol 3,4,5-trisphosphate 3-phosphatase TPTE2-like isoform X2 [Panonychus citri]|uniref:phosphatidylinositol 3,4,5-trisphosphate 3-phosphatase TPTE2-like isoform X2 n=1 Tax=Panonychus citri TaxID=50023 RepID=UPI002307E9DC|nr:phosphatidylinositol 3,4,5-trisphosphate 3-phosphatase TPTE2-like isoform X2 [Panonychus citri]
MEIPNETNSERELKISNSPSTSITSSSSSCSSSSSPNVINSIPVIKSSESSSVPQVVIMNPCLAGSPINTMGKGDMDESLVSNEAIPTTKYEELSNLVQTRSSVRDKLYRLVQNIFFRLATLILIIIDCILTVVDLSLGNKEESLQSSIDTVVLIFAIIFCIEVCLRIYAIGVDHFFIDWYNCVDFVIIIMSFMITCIYIIIHMSNNFAKLIILARLIRVMVLVRLFRVVTEPKNIQKGVRLVVSENKRRYRGDGFDLDLTYITPRVIGMSFPSSGSWAFYRNHIKDVARFFDSKHGPDNFKIYNLCSEKSYDVNYFHGRVARYPIDDHNVPTLEQMMRFVEDVKEWLGQDEKNVIAAHCKGGKGRTGTMICAWLIYNGHFDECKEVLEYFADRRTDTSVGKKYQGVETPSQARYIEYFSRIINQMNGKLPVEGKTVNLKSISIEGLSTIGAGDGSDLSASIMIDRSETFNLDFGTETNCTAFYNKPEDILIITPKNCPSLKGDVRIKFNCRSKSVPRAYEDCAFYFWFNCNFIEGNSLSLIRSDVDNPHKSKTWKIYTEKFRIICNFD